MYALVDCNNFYASCERVFQPQYNGKPVVILSNNDGCVISRSNEAKEVGVPMGAPEFKIRELLKEKDIKVFSSNYPLYGDLSNRVMKILEGFTPNVEIYSIDGRLVKSIHAISNNYYDLNADDLSDQIYFYKVIFISFIQP